jgi:hypothetical protein
MYDVAKTLDQMTIAERSGMMIAVAEALDDVSEAAAESGDQRFAQNSRSVACTIRGVCSDMGIHDLKPAELLLEQGILLIQSFEGRNAVVLKQ